MMRARFGRVVAISSMVARNPAAPGQCNYVASKAAIHGFVRSVAKEVAARGITVNAIAAGFVATDLSRAVLRARPGVVLAIPMKRVAEPVEIASLVAYLATDGAQYVTGEVIGATGGMCQ
jgi:3-oxoacyl-[acyl-carrier protein] reductase